MLPLMQANTVLRARCLIGVALFANALDDVVTARTMGIEALEVAGRLNEIDLVG